MFYNISSRFTQNFIINDVNGEIYNVKDSRINELTTATEGQVLTVQEDGTIITSATSLNSFFLDLLLANPTVYEP